MADAITLLRDDHRTVEKLFKSFEKAGENAAVTKKRLVKSMIEELSVHAAIEEQVFYPAVRAEVSGTNDEVLEALEEHHIVKWELSELDGSTRPTNASAPRSPCSSRTFATRARGGGPAVPAVRAALGRTRLAELGADLEAIRRVAPTKPHPRSPQEPPANLVVGAVAGMVDQATETVKRVARRA